MNLNYLLELVLHHSLHPLYPPLSRLVQVVLFPFMLPLFGRRSAYWTD